MKQVVMTVKEVAKILGVHPSTVCHLIKSGSIPALRIGSDWLFQSRIGGKMRH
jgi:excisionase family DNA binding protein